MKTSTCTLLAFVLIASFGCSSTTRMPPTNQDPRWDEDSRTLEIMLQWVGRKQGITYVLDPRLEVLGMRIIPEQPMTPEKVHHDLTHLYRLQFKPLANGIIEVVPLEPMSFYEQFTSLPHQPRIRL
jgi:hypothetical protein